MYQNKHYYLFTVFLQCISRHHCYFFATKLSFFSHKVMSDSCELTDSSLPGFSAHVISQAKILEWVAVSFSRESSQSEDRTQASCIGSWILYH